LWVTWALVISGLAAQAQGNQFNTNGNILISDQFNNRVIEVNPDNHKIVWHFGTGSNTPGPDTIIGVNDAQRIGDFILMARTGSHATVTGDPGTRPAMDRRQRPKTTGRSGELDHSARGSNSGPAGRPFLPALRWRGMPGTQLAINRLNRLAGSKGGYESQKIL